MALAQIVITVAVGTSDFQASAVEENNTATNLNDAVTGLLTKIATLHDKLQDVPDADLSQEGKDFRDTPLSFDTPPAPSTP